MENDLMEEVVEDTAEDTTINEVNQGAEELLDKEQECTQAEVEIQEEAENDAVDEAQPEEKVKKGLRKKEKKDKKDEKIEELIDQVKRQMAEFDNYRKRTEKEKQAMYEVGVKSVVEKMLPIVDNFERVLQTIPTGDIGTPFVEGIEMVYKQLMTSFEQIGIKPIEAIGQEFNPNLHNAVLQVESEEFESGIVAQELQKGYMYRDSVIRHSMVGVVQ